MHYIYIYKNQIYFRRHLLEITLTLKGRRVQRGSIFGQLLIQGLNKYLGTTANNINPVGVSFGRYGHSEQSHYYCFSDIGEWTFLFESTFIV